MQTPQQVLDASFLDVRYMLLEIAAMFDRYDAAVARDSLNSVQSDNRRKLLREAVHFLADAADGPTPQDRAETLLNLFSDET